MSDALEPYRLALRVGAALEACGAAWAVGGSLASSVHGTPRATHDVDLVADLDVFDRDAIVARLSPMGYIDAEAVAAAIARGTAFNFIDDASLDKVDIFCVRGLQAGQIARRRTVSLAEGVVVPILGPEDIVVQKLRWYQLGGQVSDRQWRDVLEVVRVQGPRFDWPLARTIADEIGVRALLDEAGP